MGGREKGRRKGSPESRGDKEADDGKWSENSSKIGGSTVRHSELEQLIIFPTLLLAKARFVTRVKSRWARSPFLARGETPSLRRSEEGFDPPRGSSSTYFFPSLYHILPSPLSFIKVKAR